jgi:hypothetical protein
LPYAGDRPGKKPPILTVPRQLDDSGALWAADRLRALAVEPELTIDFRPLEFALPYGTVVLASTLRELVQTRARAGLSAPATFVPTTQGTSPTSYLSHVGFFEYSGLSSGDIPTSRQGETYLGITSITRSELEATRGEDLIQDAIEKRSQQLAALVFEDESKQDMLAYCFRETIRNVFEHASTDHCVVMAQKYDSHVVEIAIADEGIGVYESIRHTHDVSSPSAAVKLSIEPGVSRVDTSADDSRWGNSGYGLWVISTLGRRHGSFRITSSGASLYAGVRGSGIRSAPVPGTAIKLRVNTEDAEYFPNILDQIVQEGEARSASKTGRLRPASKGSKSSGRR